MLDDAVPAPKIRRWEFVTVPEGRWAGRRGTVLWLDRPRRELRTGAWREWAYCVHCPGGDAYGSFPESVLRPTGELDDEEAHRGRGFEIGFDCVLGSDNAIVEGSYRVPGRHWEVFLFRKKDVPALRHHLGTWRSGITGVEFDVPMAAVLNREAMLRAMSAVFGAGAWTEVRGPDSLLLK